MSIQEYTFIVQQVGKWWIGWVEEVPGVNCQERTREELLESLKITLNEALEFEQYQFCKSKIAPVTYRPCPE